jgi:hypothetical protein
MTYLDRFMPDDWPACILRGISNVVKLTVGPQLAENLLSYHDR